MEDHVRYYWIADCDEHSRLLGFLIKDGHLDLINIMSASSNAQQGEQI